MTTVNADKTRTGFFRRLSGLGSRMRLLLPGVSRNITEHKQVEEELRRTHDELEQLVQGGAAQLRNINETLQAQVVGRQRAEHALAAERNLLRGLIDNLPDRIYVRDRQCRYLNDNIAHAQFLGASTPDKVVGKSAADFLPLAQAEQYEAMDRQIMESNQPLLNIEEVVTQSDGTHRWSLTTKVPLHDAGGNVVGIVGISHDITQRKEIELILAKQRSQLDALMDNIPDAIYFKDRQSRFTQINRAQANRFGLTDPAQAVGKTDFDFFSQEHAQPAFDDEQEVIRTGQPVVGKEEKETWPDGHVTWVSTTKEPLRDQTGNIIGTFGISRDITQRKETELALAQQRSQLDALTENIPDAIYFKDRQSRFTLINRAQANRFGLTDPAQAVGKTDFDFFSQEHAQPAFDDEQEVIRTGQPVVGKEEKETWPDGHVTWVSTTKEPLRDQTGNIIGTFGISRDITEHKKSEDELEFAYLELENSREELLEALENLKKSHEQLKLAQLQLIQAEKLQSVGRLAAGVAHEVRNPLAIITLGLDYLAADLGPKDAIAAQVISDTQAALKRADSIVRGLLDFAVPHDLDLHDEQINEVVDQSLRLLKHPLALGHIVVVRELKDNLPLLHLDHIKIQQVFINLFLNAIQAMPHGGTLTIRTDTRRLDPSEARRDAGDRSGEHFRAGELVVVAEVDDTGTGIPPEALAKVFDAFFTTKPAGQGTGLGLTVAQKIVELHGGRIDVRNRPKGGARATIMFRTKEG